jgi:uncharacterized oxidoreductase
MIPSYVRSHAQGYLQLNRHASVMKDAGAVVTLDGNGGFGQVVAHEAMQIGIEKARQHGMAAVRCATLTILAASATGRNSARPPE